MARAIWKGAISFGLVHIPVALVSATRSQRVDFDWLDERSMEPVGYKRINKVTGREVPKHHIAKGVKFEKGRYVILTEEEIRSAHPRSTQTIDIFSFVSSDQIPLANIDKPYYLSPDKRGEKVYALLRETLVETGKVALARVVIRTRQYLAALMPLESALSLIILRWPAEVRSLETLDLGEQVTDPKLSKSELAMARRLVEDMTAEWSPEEYVDSFQDEIMQLVEQKASEGQIEDVEAGAAISEERKSADIIDLTELLKRSLAGKRDNDSAAKQTSKPTATRTAKAKMSSTKASGAKSSKDKSAKEKNSKQESSKQESSEAKKPGSKNSTAKTSSRKAPSKKTTHRKASSQ